MITDPRLLRSSLVVLGLTLVGFVLHGVLHLEPATIALTGAIVLMIVAREDPHEVLREVEWPTLFFFIGLFMLVAGVIEIGLIDAVADAIIAVTGGVLAPTTILVMWASAMLSGVIDNIPYTATMIPVVAQLSTGHETDALWWGLAIGADLGGNATIIGASANVILASMAEREGHRDLVRRVPSLRAAGHPRLDGHRDDLRLAAVPAVTSRPHDLPDHAPPGGRTSGSDSWETEMRDDGEPISRGQFDRQAAGRRALKNALFAAAFFGGVVLVNGILAILLIGFAQAMGWWEVRPAGGTPAAWLASGAFAMLLDRAA